MPFLLGFILHLVFLASVVPVRGARDAPRLWQGRFKIGVGTARSQHLDSKRKLRGDGPSPPLLGRIPESTLAFGLPRILPLLCAAGFFNISALCRAVANNIRFT